MELVRAFVELILPIAVLGLIIWLIEFFWPTCPPRLKTLFRVLAGVLIVLYLLNWFGIYSFPVRRSAQSIHINF